MTTRKEDKLRLLSSIPFLKNRNKSVLKQRSSSVTLFKRRNKMLINNDVKLKSLNVSQMNIYKNNNSSLIDLKEREKEIKTERKINELNINLKKDLLDKIDIFIENAL